MATMNDDPAQAASMRLRAHICALNVKEVGVRFPNQRCGIIVQPCIPTGRVKNDTELYELLEDMGLRVIVAGHGIIPGDDFVWQGEPHEFARMWEGD